MMQDVYICHPKRSAIGRYAGGLSQVRPDDLLAAVIKGVLSDTRGCDANAIEDVFIGCANQSGEDNRNIARMSALLAGLPETVPGVTLNRLCASGMDAVAGAFRAIRCGEMQLALAGGVESMTRAPYVMGKSEQSYGRKQVIEDTTMGWRFINPKLQQLYGTETMPETAENVAERFAISREDQDLFALNSQQKTTEALAIGAFKNEIVPIIIPQRRGEDKVFEQDEHPRSDTRLDKLASLATPFRQHGSVTAGNASGINDGAAAMLIASESAVAEQQLTPLAKILGIAVAGVEPGLMGVGPVPATNKLLARLGLSMDDMDIIELNEAFAAQALACCRQLGLADNDPRVNPLGGAIALGHPLGMSGARLVLTAAQQLESNNKRYALCTMCIGVGQGIACVIERV